MKSYRDIKRAQQDTFEHRKHNQSWRFKQNPLDERLPSNMGTRSSSCVETLGMDVVLEIPFM